ncbi:biotin--protein ligase [Pseudomonas syringae pv. syringae]|nr:biotin--protein ligase [Pseudomonas syringae pv. syringae]
MLKLLADGAFHSGQVLGDALGISRSAVWKQLQQLEADLGIDVHKVRGRGYRLATPISLLSPADIMQSGFPAGWSFAENLYYSLVLRIDGGMRQLEGLSLLVGLAVMNVLRDMGVQDARLKWPNDVLVGRQKIAGILLELIGDPADVCHVIIGIGVNVNMRSSSEVDQLWTSVRLETGGLVDRNQVAARISTQLEALMAVHRKEGFAAFQKEWERGHVWQGAAVKLLSGVEVVEGVVLGVDSLGALRLEVNGVEKSFSGGELSLRLRDDS